MVQRKVPNKPGIQADHVKSEKRLGNLKPTSCQHQDGKNRGPDMRKKMKRSRSIKRSDIESLNSPPSRKTISQLGKPPPFNAPSAAATPQKQPIIKTGGSPNYMKATSSSEARKEHSQVSTSTGSDSKNLRRRNSSNSKTSSASSNKPTRTSSKLVRTLTKTPSFKPARSTAKKCSRVALCADINVQKATCSSTLKDSKFPEYLMLNPGGTDAEGTSVLKVCPYTYCSLNGHHHTPLPPLKCFLKARRRSLKAQMSAILEVLSPRRTKLSGDGTEEISSELNFSDDKPLHKEEDSIDTATTPVVKEADKDFFIEIYAKNMVGGTEAIEKHRDGGEGSIGVTGESNEQNGDSSSQDGNQAAAKQENKEQVTDNLSDASSDKDDSISESSDMEWEEGQFSTSDIYTEIHYLDKPDKESYISVEYLSDIKKVDLPDEPEIIHSDDILGNCTEEILVDDILQELFEAETASFGTQCNDNDFGIEDVLQAWETIESIQVTGDSTCDQISSIEDAIKEPITMEETNEEAEGYLTGAMIISNSMREPVLESEAANENFLKVEVCEIEDATVEKNPQFGDAENDCDVNLTAEALNAYQDDECLQAEEVTKLLKSQIADSSQIFYESSKVETNESQKPDKTEADPDGAEVNDYQNHFIAEDSSASQELVDENSPPKHCDHLLDGQYHSINVAENQNLFKEDQDGANKFKTPTSTDSEQIDLSLTECNAGKVMNMEVEVCNKSETAETFLATGNGNIAGSNSKFLHKRSNFNQEIGSTCDIRKWTIKCKKHIMDLEEERTFNPKEPNFLPVVPDPESEKVDLRHQIMDDRKNAEEWMLDYALQQAVTKLAPARKRKVALLVEAFETVLPIPKYESHIRHASAAFSHSRPIQACS
ncbi:hypothetical protein JCGZ_24500 [Jatropha curcas]|uniref:Calmodulin-binding domain-containing protein n=1 Tax=Jatropha curcas TaxID=180498 RepID=A0A067KWB3_JATCU|nr:calmodulin binding protein PICBP [Jatropha curcas]XP_020533978.1 calmodulin binding protein PICBP [Jatropha curcas]KDP40501.1 hypothetical protein JCGZ_24500 [Jatropha curcas]